MFREIDYDVDSRTLRSGCLRGVANSDWSALVGIHRLGAWRTLAAQLKRRFIGIDYNGKTCEITRKIARNSWGERMHMEAGEDSRLGFALPLKL